MFSILNSYAVNSKSAFCMVFINCISFTLSLNTHISNYWFGLFCVRYLEVNMNSGVVVWPLFNSLQAFWPGLQVQASYNILNSFRNDADVSFIL